MKKKSSADLLVLGLLVLLSHLPTSAAAALKLESYLRRPKLVVVLVVDQFRADYLTRFESRFLPSSGKPGQLGGFRYLMKGAYFPFAEYEHLQTTTCPGHAAILTGAYPYAHRIAINEWYDSANGKDVYCVNDDDAKLVGVPAEALPGVSPKLLKTTTVGDELKAAGHSSRVVGIALKDRSAVLLGGHRADLAIWFDGSAYKWISSKYYLPDDKLPEWLEKLNAGIDKRRNTQREWKSRAETGLSSSFGAGAFSREITFGSRASLASPIGVDLTTEAALAAVRAYGLGGKPSPDILAISYSSHDMLGHKMGPNSREMEEMTIAEDRSLAELFKGLEKSVPGGMKNVLVVLTGDHGVAQSRGNLIYARFEAGAIDQEAMIERLNKALDKKFGETGGKKWIVRALSFNFYLDRKLIQEKKLEAKDVEAELKALLLKEPAAAAVLTRTDYLNGNFPPGMHGRQAKITYVLDQSGDVIMIPKPFYTEDKDPVTHVTGYNYDRMVPIALAGPNIRSAVHPEHVHVVDLAPTLSFLLGVIAPAHSEGRVLSEAIRNEK